MYKVFSGEKCVIISSGSGREGDKNARVISFKSTGDLHKEYRQFSRQSKLKKLIITGEEEVVWRAFRSLFKYIEAAGGVVQNEKGQFLMIYRNRHWDLPKGKMEKGESPASTAVREVEEECRVTGLRIVKQLPPSYHIFFQDADCLKCTHWYRMLCPNSVEPVPQTEEGITEARWMSREEIKKVSQKIYSSLRESLIPLILETN